MKFKNWLIKSEMISTGAMSGATTSADIAAYPKPVFGVIRKDLVYGPSPRRKRGRSIRRRHIKQ